MKDRDAAPRSGEYDNVKRSIEKALRALPVLTVQTAYQAWLGFYNSHLRQNSNLREVDVGLNDFPIATLTFMQSSAVIFLRCEV